MNPAPDAQPAPAQPGAPAPRWGAPGWALVLIVFAVGFAEFPLRVVGSGGEYLPGDVADNRLNNFVLEHGYRCLVAGRPDRFRSAPAFYPARSVTAWSDAHFGMLPVYALLRVAGLSPEGAFQGYFLVPFVLNFAAAVWAARRLKFGPVGASAAAFVFTFGLPVVGQLTHAQLFPRFLVPPAVVFAWEFLGAPRTRALAAVAACCVGQLYLTVYIGYFLVLLLATGGLVAATRFRRVLPWNELLRPGRRVWFQRIGIVLGTALAIAPLVLFHTGAAGWPLETVRETAPRPGAWLTPALIGGAFPELGRYTKLDVFTAGPEQQLLAGLVPLAAVAVGLLTVVRPARLTDKWSVAAVAAWTAVLLGLLVTRFGDVWLYEPFAHLPGASGIRATGRIVLVLLFPASIATAALVDSLTRAASRIQWALGAAVAVLLLAAVAGDQWLTATNGPRGPEWGLARCSCAERVARQERLATAVRRHPAPKLVYVFPSAAGGAPFEGVVLQIEAMRAAQNLGLPCVNGYSGSFPLEWDAFRGYRELLEWLTEKHRVPPEVLAGLVVVGEPVPDADPRFEASMRERFPPQLVP